MTFRQVAPFALAALSSLPLQAAAGADSAWQFSGFATAGAVYTHSDELQFARVGIDAPGGNKVDTTFIDNAAQAHLDAFDHLAPGAACAGKAYFISNGEPWPMRDVLNGLLRAAGAPIVTRRLPFRVAYAIGVICEGLWSVLPLKGDPPMTRFLAEQLSTSHWYSMAPATRDFGYVPKVTMAEGLERLRVSIRS